MSVPRLYLPPDLLSDASSPWTALPPPGTAWPLPAALVRHIQVLRLQPGDAVRLFGAGCPPQAEVQATVLSMGRQAAEVRIDAVTVVDRELPADLCLAIGMPANDRMDALVEKATELGAAQIQPLVCRRSVLRLDGERAARRVAHWAGVAGAAAEQSGRTAVPLIAPVATFERWLAVQQAAAPSPAAQPVAPSPTASPTAASDPWRLVLSTGTAPTLQQAWAARGSDTAPSAMRSIWLLSGPEGGFDPQEEAAAVAAGFQPVSLGPRILRADTAPLAALALLGAWLDEH